MIPNFIHIYDTSAHLYGIKDFAAKHKLLLRHINNAKIVNDNFIFTRSFLLNVNFIIFLIVSISDE